MKDAVIEESVESWIEVRIVEISGDDQLEETLKCWD